MNPTAVLGEAFGLYKTHWRHLLPIAFVVYLVLSLFTLLLVLLLSWVGAIAGPSCPWQGRSGFRERWS